MTQQNQQPPFLIQTSATQQLVAEIVTTDFANLQKKQGYKVPEGYNVSNALQAAVSALPQVKDIDRATPDSVKKSLFDMVVQGLDPSKTQAYFIVYGNQLQMQRSYFGTQQVLKRLPEIDDIHASVVRAGEEFEVDYEEAGDLIVTNHKTSFGALDGEIIGAYAVIKMTDGTKRYEVMTKKQIDQAWDQSKTKNVQNKFPAEMAKRTVINRAAKNIINTTTADSALAQAINGTTSNEYDNDKLDVTPKTETTSSSILSKLAQKAEKPVEVVSEEVETMTAEEVVEVVEKSQSEPTIEPMPEPEGAPITTADIIEAEVIDPEIPFEPAPEGQIVEETLLFNTTGELMEEGATNE